MHMLSHSRKIALIRNLVLIIAIALIFSFVLHDIIPHHHPHQLFGNGPQAALHSNDKKWWYLMLLAFVFVTTDLVNKWRLDTGGKRNIFFISPYFRLDIAKLFNPILQALRRGILNPKLCD